MPNPQIDKVNVNGTTYDIVDSTSGYTTNTGTITSVKTTVGAHTTINVSSGAANFNVPTKTSHLTNDSGFLTSYTETDPVFSASAAADITSTDINNWNSKTSNTGTVTSVRVQATSPVQSSTNTAQSTSLDTTISLADAYGDTKNPYGSKTKNYVLAAPSNAAGAPSFRALVAGDIPDLSGTYLTSYTETDPTVPSWAKQSTKPSYTASEVGAVATSAVGAASGVVPLNASSKIDSTYLPSYVDDVIEGYYYNNKFWKEGSHTTEITGEAGKIYVDLSTDKTYRYSGTAFVEISKGGSVVTVSRDLTSGTKVGVVSVDGTTYQLYAPTPASATQSATTGISIAAHGTGTVTGVQSTTTTASKVTLGTAFSVPNITSVGSASTWTFEEKSIPNVTSAGSASTWTFEEKTIPNVTSAGSASTWTFEEKTIPNVTAAGSGSYTQGSFNGGSFTQGTDSFTANTPTIINTSKFSGGSYSHSGFNGGSFTRGSFSGGSLAMAMDTTDTKKLKITFTAATHANDSFTAATYGTDNFTAASLQTGFYTAGTAASFTQGEDEFTPATHGADSHTHTAPTIGTAIKVQSKSGGGNGSAPTLGTAIKVQSKSGGANGSAPTLGTAIKVQSKSGGANGSAPTLGTAFSIPNVTGATDVTVPIKNTSASTFVTGTTHTITDNGHTHNI